MLSGIANRPLYSSPKTILYVHFLFSRLIGVSVNEYANDKAKSMRHYLSHCVSVSQVQ